MHYKNAHKKRINITTRPIGLRNAMRVPYRRNPIRCIFPLIRNNRRVVARLYYRISSTYSRLYMCAFFYFARSSIFQNLRTRCSCTSYVSPDRLHSGDRHVIIRCVFASEKTAAGIVFRSYTRRVYLSGNFRADAIRHSPSRRGPLPFLRRETP